MFKVQLRYIKERWNVEPGKTPLEVFSALATNADRANARTEVDAVVKLLDR